MIENKNYLKLKEEYLKEALEKGEMPTLCGVITPEENRVGIFPFEDTVALFEPNVATAKVIKEGIKLKIKNEGIEKPTHFFYFTAATSKKADTLEEAEKIKDYLKKGNRLEDDLEGEDIIMVYEESEDKVISTIYPLLFDTSGAISYGKKNEIINCKKEKEEFKKLCDQQRLFGFLPMD